MDIIKPLLENDGYNLEFINIDTFESLIKELQNYFEFIKKNKIRAIIGIGGGKAIDAAKLLASFSQKPFISIPTTVSHDGVSSPAVSYLITLKLNLKYNLKYKMISPYAIIADTEIIKSTDWDSIKAGIGDLIAKFTAVRDWKLANLLNGEEYSEYAASMALMSARLIEKNLPIITKHKESAIPILVKALIGSGIAISVAGTSRPASGSEHLFSHALDILAEKENFKNQLHGIQCGIGTIIMGILHNLNYKRIKNLLAKINFPLTYKELNIDKKYLIKALTIANKIRKDRYTIISNIEITEKVASNLLKKAEII